MNTRRVLQRYSRPVSRDAGGLQGVIAEADLAVDLAPVIAGFGGGPS